MKALILNPVKSDARKKNKFIARWIRSIEHAAKAHMFNSYIPRY